jgi:hypothetical protein
MAGMQITQEQLSAALRAIPTISLINPGPQH